MAPINVNALRAARRFVRDVQREGVRLEGAYLFGSYATGHASASSDIDIALVSPDFTGWVDDLEKIRNAVLAMDARIEPVRFRPDTFVDENPLAWQVKRKGISLLPKSVLASRPGRKGSHSLKAPRTTKNKSPKTTHRQPKSI
jgi:predicted nucleotidyltransferase